MKNQKGFSLVEGLLAVMVIAIVGFGGYYVWAQRDDEEMSSNETAQQEPVSNQQEEQPTEEVSTIPEGWVAYENAALAVTFMHPEQWGEPISSEFDENRNYQYFVFSKNDDVYFGAPESDYSTEGRGGSMTDFSGFKEESGSYIAKTLTDEYDSQLNGYVSVGDSGIVSYSADFFESKVYHALFNTTGVTTGLNFIGNAADVSQSEFKQLVESIEVI